MQSAMRNSVVWVYQIIARRIGAERMQNYLHRLDYGNRDISGGIDQFWLASSLKITPRQQLELVQSLHDRSLPFPAEDQEWVERLISQEYLGRPTVFGKTGSGLRDGDSFGWFIGYQEKKDISRYFVLFIRDVDGRKAYGITARDLVFRLLDALD
jgi:beta-lactamase class D